MNKPTLSIITPVYNSAKYLKECIESILSQSFKDIELILIDDGSTDNSLEICRRYVLSDNRVRVKSVVNGGPASARNHGLDMAKGEYVMFVDSDDWIDVGSLEMLMSEMRSDLLYFGMKTVAEDGKVKLSYPVTTTSRYIDNDTDIDSTITALLNPNCDVAGYVGNKLFSNRIIQEKHLRFDTSIRLGEDAIFSALYWNHISTLQLSLSFPYNYRVINTSITRSSSVATLHLSFALGLQKIIDKIKRPMIYDAHLTKTFWAYYRHLSYNINNFNRNELEGACSLLLSFYNQYKPNLGYQGRYLKYILSCPVGWVKTPLLIKYIRYI